jgi:hypothetical protein
VNPILLGRDANGRPLHLTPEQRRSSHMHVIGGTRTGKSKFLEWMMHKDLREGHGFCLIDWHGTLYRDLLYYCALLDVGLLDDFRKVILLNPCQPDFITGFNPFANPGEDISTQVNRWIDATVRPWGGSDTDEMPTFERVTRILYTFMAESKQTLPNAAGLLDPEGSGLRDYAMRITQDNYTRSQLRRFQGIKTLRDWEDKVLSAENRLSRFIGSKGVRRFMGLQQNNIDLMDIMDKGHILLVNLGDSEFLDRKAATVYASLFLYEFMQTAMRRALRAQECGEKPSLYPVYLDEFQNYITDDVAAILDQALKGGLHMVLAHQHLGHFAENPRLRKSIFTNARIRAVFGGLDYEDACMVANEMFLPDLNTRQIKKAYYHTIYLYREETRTVRSHGHSHASSHTSGTSTGSGTADSTGSVSGTSSGYSAPGLGPSPTVEGWFTEGTSSSDISSSSNSDFSSTSESDSESESETYGETVVPVWVPIPKQELTTESEWTREEKLSRVAEMLKCQQQAHCFIKLDMEKTQPLRVPFVKDPGLSPQFLLEYQRDVYAAQGALPAAEVDRLIEESQQQFLAAAGQVIDADFEHEPAEKPEVVPAKEAWTRPAPKAPPSRGSSRTKKAVKLFSPGIP